MKIVTSRISEESPSPAANPSARRLAPPSGTPIPQPGAAASVVDFLRAPALHESATDLGVTGELRGTRYELRAIDHHLDRLDHRARQLEVRFHKEIAAVWRSRQRWYTALLFALALAYTLFR